MSIYIIQNGASPLHIASQEGHSKVVDVLVKNGADINKPTNVGRGYIDSFCMFITNSSYKQNGATPLYRASQEGHSDTVATLIRKGAKINQPRNVGGG